VLAGDEQYHSDEDKEDSGPEENAHDSSRYEPVATDEATPQRVAHCATHQHSIIVLLLRWRYVIVTSCTT